MNRPLCKYACTIALSIGMIIAMFTWSTGVASSAKGVVMSTGLVGVAHVDERPYASTTRSGTAVAPEYCRPYVTRPNHAGSSNVFALAGVTGDCRYLDVEIRIILQVLCPAGEEDAGWCWSTVAVEVTSNLRGEVFINPCVQGTYRAYAYFRINGVEEMPVFSSSAKIDC